MNHNHKHPHPHRNLHSHMWIMGVVGMAAGLFLLLYVPTLEPVSKSILLFAGFHIVGGLIALASLYVVGLRSVMRRLFGGGAGETRTTYQFGWGPGWMNGLAIAALAAGAGAVLASVAAPAHWPLALLLAALATLFLVGNAVMSSFRRLDHVVLPMVDLLSGDSDIVLDAGCGSGRTTIALKRVLKRGTVIALDRFDAGYIDNGGRALLERNLAIAGLSDRVRIEVGDLTAMPLAPESIDSIVSTHAFDHLGSGKQAALDEAFRVLRPGGRFLMAVWTPGLSMFAVANVLSFFLTSKERWRKMARRAGFEIADEGVFNNTWFVVLAKPQTPAA